MGLLYRDKIISKIILLDAFILKLLTRLYMYVRVYHSTLECYGNEYLYHPQLSHHKHILAKVVASIKKWSGLEMGVEMGVVNCGNPGNGCGYCPITSRG